MPPFNPYYSQSVDGKAVRVDDPLTALWDEFAKAALTGFLASFGPEQYGKPENVAKQAFDYADAMMAERAKRKEARP